MISFFEHIGAMTSDADPPVTFQVCFSSRHYPHITIKHGLSLVLEQQQEHANDIARYTHSELNIGHSKLAKQIRTELQEKASGVFMWVVLVTQILNKEHDSGHIHRLRTRLRDIPGDLHELFRDILVRDHHDRGELLLCIQWVLFAREPLRPEELYYAILSGLEPEALSERDCNELTGEVMQRFILSSSKGLTEVTKSWHPTVQFIHESVKDFLLKENGLREIWSDLGGNFEAASHERLKECCLSYRRIQNSACLVSLGHTPPPMDTEQEQEVHKSISKRFPFLAYATQNVLHHADAAEEGGISQADFLQSFSRQLPDWVKLNILFEPEQHRRLQHAESVSFLYVLATLGAAALIKLLPSSRFCFEVEDERYGTAFFAALATGSDKVTQCFVDLISESLPAGSLLRTFGERFPRTRDDKFSIDKRFTFAPGRSAFSYAAAKGDEPLMALIIASQAYDAKEGSGRCPPPNVDAAASPEIVHLLPGLQPELEIDAESITGANLYGPTPLLWAAANGHVNVVKLLLETGTVDLDAKNGGDGGTPLSYAAANGHEEVVRRLLATGQVNIDSNTTRHGQTPLSYAAEEGHEAIVRLLLEAGEVDVEAKDNVYGQTPLSWAAENGNENVVRLLLEIGKADVNSKSKSGQTPLLLASCHGREAVVRLLLATGKADVGSKDDCGWTPLAYAVDGGYETVVRLLLETGQVDGKLENLQGRFGELWWATKPRHDRIAQLLLKAGLIDPKKRKRPSESSLSVVDVGEEEGTC